MSLEACRRYVERQVVDPSPLLAGSEDESAAANGQVRPVGLSSNGNLEHVSEEGGGARKIRYLSDRKVAEGRIKTQLGAFAIAGGMAVSLSPTTTRGEPSYLVQWRHDQPRGGRRQWRTILGPRTRSRTDVDA